MPCRSLAAARCRLPSAAAARPPPASSLTRQRAPGRAWARRGDGRMRGGRAIRGAGSECRGRRTDARRGSSDAHLHVARDVPVHEQYSPHAPDAMCSHRATPGLGSMRQSCGLLVSRARLCSAVQGSGRARCSSVCSWLHPLKSRSLQETRGGSSCLWPPASPPCLVGPKTGRTTRWPSTSRPQSSYTTRRDTNLGQRRPLAAQRADPHLFGVLGFQEP